MCNDDRGLTLQYYHVKDTPTTLNVLTNLQQTLHSLCLFIKIMFTSYRMYIRMLSSGWRRKVKRRLSYGES